MLKLRQAEQAERVQQESERLARLQSTLQLIEKENSVGNDVVIKEVEPQWIASIREVLPSYAAVGRLYGELFQHLGGPPCGNGGLTVALWHDKEYKESDIDGEAGVYLQRPTEPKGRMMVYELPGGTVASVIHAGAWKRLGEAYSALASWIETNGYTPCGAARELYLKMSPQPTADDESSVTEVQIPVIKSADLGDTK